MGRERERENYAGLKNWGALEKGKGEVTVH